MSSEIISDALDEKQDRRRWFGVIGNDRIPNRESNAGIRQLRDSSFRVASNWDNSARNSVGYLQNPGLPLPGRSVPTKGPVGDPLQW